MKICSSKKAERGKDMLEFRWMMPFEVLGCAVGPCGSAWEDFKKAELAVWKRCWCGAGSRKSRSLPLNVKLIDVERCCWPAVSYRCSWWPIGSTLSSRIAALQRSVIASILKIPREVGETDESYACRRGREAAKHACLLGPWEVRAAGRVVDWTEHLERHHVRSWAAELYAFQGSKWLQLRRAAQSSASVFAGMLGLREWPGRPRVRFDEGVSHAREIIAHFKGEFPNMQ